MKLKGRQSSNVQDLRRFKDPSPNTITPQTPSPPIPKRVSDDLERAAQINRLKTAARARTRMGSVPLSTLNSPEVDDMRNRSGRGALKNAPSALKKRLKLR